jgi:hypothetical protein
MPLTSRPRGSSPDGAIRRYLPGRQEAPLAQNPDPTVKLTTSKGVTRTLDDWTTMFHLCLVVLPSRPEASAWIPVARRIFATFGDADCRCAFLVAGPEQVAARLLGGVEEHVMTFVDPDLEFVRSLGLQRLPAFVHLRQDTALLASAEGWDPREWQRVAREIGTAMAWSVPELVGTTDEPAPTPGWPISAS